MHPSSFKSRGFIQNPGKSGIPRTINTRFDIFGENLNHYRIICLLFSLKTSKILSNATPLSSVHLYIAILSKYSRLQSEHVFHPQNEIMYETLMSLWYGTWYGMCPSIWYVVWYVSQHMVCGMVRVPAYGMWYGTCPSIWYVSQHMVCGMVCVPAYGMWYGTCPNIHRGLISSGFLPSSLRPLAPSCVQYYKNNSI